MKIDKTNEFVLGFLFNIDCTKVILIRKEKPYWQKGFYNGVGGKVQEGELPIEAMRREFREETGVDIFYWKYFGYIYDFDNKISLFTSLCQTDSFVEIFVSNKTEELVAEIFLDNIKTIPIVYNLHWLIPMAREIINSSRNMEVYITNK